MRPGSNYDQTTAARLTAALRGQIKFFSNNVLAYCRPYQSDDRIEEMFDKLFDGYEVLPATLENEYRRKLEDEPFLAPVC